MGNNNLNYEEYPAIGDALIASFNRDQSELAEHYKMMNADFVIEFQNAIDAVRKTASVLAKTEELKSVTRQLYGLADEANQKLLFLIDYARDAGLESASISNIRSKLTTRNIEGAVYELREVLPYLESHQAELDAGNMPKDFLKYFPPILPQLEAWNAEQIAIVSNRKSLVEGNKILFENAYSYISKVSNNGKKVFKDTVKKDDYTISKLLTKVRVEGKGEEGPKS
ncbi:hypothetical protein [Epilithonimonas hungarica]|uniref:Uncharacterized protein n=1 Tax=Epilithonimonas hungarica TaxID=454006 RepID=A0A1G7VL97_9FLAO|nr:hypothetical protein [Epilithonimonas hungarica]SDG60523.1 hypothetical protein SAMN05421825_3671 [Epilithonimonas hungarica]